jgi:nucleotide-binding universal stress UspA family protein
VVVDGSELALDRGREFAAALGVAWVTCSHPARMRARLVVADDRHVRWHVHHARSPLLVARAPTAIGAILVAIDRGDPAESALEWAVRLARARPTTLTLAHSIEPGISTTEWMANFGGSDVSFVPDDVEERNRAAADRLHELVAGHGLRADVRVGEAPAARFILALADQLHPGLIVLGAPRHRRLLHRTVASEVASSAACSVLVVPHDRPPPP